MANTTSEETPPDEFQETLEATNLWKYGYPPMITLGCVGNILSFIILTRRGMRSSTTNFLLTILSVSDTTNLIFAGTWMTLIARGYDWSASSSFACKAERFIMFVNSDYSCWLLAIVALERAVAVCMPHKSKALCSKRNFTIVSILGLLILIGINFCLWFLYGVVENDDGSTICTWDSENNKAIFLGVFVWVDLCTLSLLPFIVLLICNTLIIYKIANAKKHVPTTGGSVKTINMASTTAMLISVSFVHLLTSCPLMIHNIGADSWRASADARGNASITLYWHIAMFLLYFNNAINFLLYSMSSPKFRKQLRGLFGAKLGIVSTTETQAAGFTSTAGNRSTSCDHGTQRRSRIFPVSHDVNTSSTLQVPASNVTNKKI